jgi:16S rRNA (guanine(966)-N(2))-methyltransferase RsmD
MRVITGSARGRKLVSPPGLDTRPTSDMLKQSIFNIIQFDVEGRRVLDLFAGSGQMGIEALSRGASEAVFVDKSAQAVDAVKKNLKICGFEARSRVQLTDAGSFLKPGCGKFGIIFLDPPYGSQLAESSLESIYAFDILSGGGIIICESDVRREFSEPGTPYYKGREYKYGKKKITVFGRDPDRSVI